VNIHAGDSIARHGDQKPAIWVTARDKTQQTKGHKKTFAGEGSKISHTRSVFGSFFEIFDQFQATEDLHQQTRRYLSTCLPKVGDFYVFFGLFAYNCPLVST
jgi:hypothetical protein